MSDAIAKIQFDIPMEANIQPQEVTKSPTRRLKVQWCSNPIWTPSGYSQQTADIGQLFLKSGWTPDNFSYIDMFGLQGGMIRDSYGILHYPMINHPMGSDAMLHHGRHFNADIIIGLFDIWGANPEDLRQIPRFIPWVPIDTDPVQPPMLMNLRFANRIITMSRFGEKLLKSQGFSSTYIPHHVDTDLFKPMDKAQAKQAFGLPPDAFIFGMISANKDGLPRKSFGQVIEAFAQFIKKYPNSFLYIHTNPDQPGGYPIKLHAAQANIANRIIFPDLYKWQFDIPKTDMPKIYSLFDVLLSPSSTEGFAIPIIEAQACGVPVIVNNYTSMPELIIENETGYITKIGCSHMMPNGQWMRFPDPEDLYKQMLKIKGMKLDIMEQAARKFVVKNYDMNTIWNEKWLLFLNRIENEIYGLTPQSKTA